MPPYSPDEVVMQAASQDPIPAAGQPQTPPELLQLTEAYQKAGAPGAAHQHMGEMAGAYDLTIMSCNGPGPEPVTDTDTGTGTATRRMILGDRAMVEQVNPQMMGQPFAVHAMTGYDNLS